MTKAPQPSRPGRRVRSDAELLHAEAEAIRELRAHATVSIATVADALRVGRDRATTAVHKGQIPSIRVGIERRIPSAWILSQLGLAPEPNSGTPPQPEGGP